MGSPTDELGRTDIESEHTVRLSRAFWLQATEVTNAQFLQVTQWALANGLAEISYESAVVLRDRGGNNDFLLVFRDAMEIGYDSDGDSLVLRDAGRGQLRHNRTQQARPCLGRKFGYRGNTGVEG